ncbi:hypothetical protein MRBBS_3007 [Marinobacter sp. BSs20148]|nr:hypothetical protein MRBBS_3007 [Marinobacter sp. BSs20148]
MFLCLVLNLKGSKLLSVFAQAVAANFSGRLSGNIPRSKIKLIIVASPTQS